MNTLRPDQTLLPLPELLRSAPVGVVAVDEAGTILFGNEKLEQLFGYKEDELIGQSIEILLPPLLRTAHRRHRSRYLEIAQHRAAELGLDLTAQHRDGSCLLYTSRCV